MSSDPRIKLIHEIVLEAQGVLQSGASRGTKPTVKELNDLIFLLRRIENLVKP